MIPRIDFVLVGAAKSGTTSLHRYLGQHPQIFTPDAKELAFFIEPEGDALQHTLLQRFYREARADQKLGLSEASMLLFDHVPRRVRDHNPEAKAVAILRDPVERAHSAYWFGRQRGWDDAPTFEEALQRELRGELRSPRDRIDFAHLEHGHYREQIARFRAGLGDERVRIVLTDDLEVRPAETLAQLFVWLGVSQGAPAIDTEQRHNVTQTTRFPGPTRALQAFSAPLRRAAAHSLPEWLQVRLRRGVLAPLRSLNAVPFERPAMKAETRDFLRAYYAERNAGLGELIGRDLSHWT